MSKKPQKKKMNTPTTELIKNAMKMPFKTTTQKNMIINDIDLFDDTKEDAISKLVKKEIKKEKAELKRKNKTIHNWTHKDFIIYFKETIKTSNVMFEHHTVRDSLVIAKLYDKILKELTEEIMSNSVLKEYIDWWISSWSSSYEGKTINIYTVSNDMAIKKFCSAKKTSQLQNSDLKDEAGSVNIDENKIYKLGGLGLLLATKGIVFASRVLKNDAQNPFEISNFMCSLKKNDVIKIIEITLKNSPYNGDMIDFMSLATPALNFHSITDYVKIDYKKHFK